MDMKKKIVIGIVVALVVLVILTGIIMYTDFGNSIVGWVYEELVLPKETVEMEPITSAKVTYTYRMQTDEKFTLERSDEELLNLIYDNIHNKKLKNYSSSIGLAIMGEYNVDLGNGVSFLFDSYDAEILIEHGMKWAREGYNGLYIKYVACPRDEDLEEFIENYLNEWKPVQEDQEKE